MSKLEIKNLHFGYEKNRKVFEDLSLYIDENETVGIIGANGVGKSTLLKLVVGLLFADEGSLLLDGELISKKTLAAIRRKEGYVFQDSDSQLFMGTVYEDVAFAPRNYGFSKEEVEAKVNRALALTGTTNLRDRHIYKLSGGEKKLAAIATILSMEPEIILMDEPSVALDPTNRERLINVVNGLPGIKLIASHDLDFIYDTCDRVIILAEGKITFDGSAKEALRNKPMLEGNGLRLPLSFRFMEGDQ